MGQCARGNHTNFGNNLYAGFLLRPRKARQPDRGNRVGRKVVGTPPSAAKEKALFTGKRTSSGAFCLYPGRWNALGEWMIFVNHAETLNSRSGTGQLFTKLVGELKTILWCGQTDFVEDEGGKVARGAGAGGSSGCVWLVSTMKAAPDRCSGRGKRKWF